MEKDTYSYFLLLNICIILFILLFFLHKLKYIKRDAIYLYKKMAYKSY